MKPPRLFLAMAVVCAGLALVVDGWSRASCICGALSCVLAYLNARNTNRK